MLLSKDAVADVIESLKGADFYIPKHELIFEAILSLYSHGEPTDVVAVTDELIKTGELGRAGGADYLHTLTSIVPTAANAGYYAGIVQERAILRRLVDAGTRIVQLGYAGEGDATDIVNNAQAEIYSVTGSETAEDYVPLTVAVDAAVEEIEAANGRDGTMTGIPTGFRELDDLTNGLHGGQMIVVAARPAMGKALALDTPLATPSGWTTMGEVQVGDELYDAHGKPTRVVAATEVMVDRPCYEIEFSDGTTIIADAEHQWVTETRAARRSATGVPQTVTTEEMLATLTIGADRRANHSVRNAAPLGGADVDLPVPPYTLGAWLGDGHSDGARMTAAVHVGVNADGGSLQLAPDTAQSVSLRVLDTAEDRRIPALYLRASAAQRRQFLAGLIDSDCAVEEGIGSYRFEGLDKGLIDSMHELVVGLGHTCERFVVVSKSESPGYGLRFSIATADERRYVKAIRPIDSVPVRCVQVDNADHMYLAGESMVPTHNSTLALDFARAASIGHNEPSIFFSLEMGKSEIAMRLLSAEGAIPLQHMRKGTLDPRDWTTVAATRGRINDAPLYIDDSPNMTLVEIRAKCRRLKQRSGLRLVVIDYLQLMTSGKRVESRQQEVSEFSRALKLLAKELQVPVIALSQLNRGAEQRSDKKPAISDLRESGSIEQDADMVILLHREAAYDKDIRPGEADLIVAKHRNGPTATITVAFQGHYSRFMDMAPGDFGGGGGGGDFN
ncbi:replicative DNA helicase [Microbacterium alcoholitolerans]|uniref:replicative DNA helicase n=1 Tax=unclassified Microbacterium TaxID=2609290 RepID=UPI003D16299D